MATLKEVYLEPKYVILKYISYAFYGLGGLIVLLGLYSSSTMLSGASSEAIQYSPIGAYAFGFAIILLLISLVLGIGMMGVAQMITLLIDMEWNQREIIELQKQQIDAIS